MKIVVFGATGPTGLQLVIQALKRAHSVTVFVRSTAGLPGPETGLRVVIGDTTIDTAKVIEAVRGQDVVISALGRHKTLSSGQLIERSMHAIVPAMERNGVHRLILMSAFGVGESCRDAPFVPRLMYRTLLKDIFQDKAVAEEYVRASRLEWTFVYPVLLTDGPLTGRYRVGEKLELRGMPKISRADVAQFMLNEAEHPAYIRKTAAIAY